MYCGKLLIGFSFLYPHVIMTVEMVRMGKRHFTEAQIILYAIILCLIILIMVPVSRKAISWYKNHENTKNIDEVVEASKNWITDKKMTDLTDGTAFYVETSELLEQNYLSKEKITGCVKVTYSEATKSYNYKYNSGTCQSIMMGKDIITKNVVTSGDGIYKVNKNYIFKGSNPNNYILINSVTYRILSVDENGIKAIRDSIKETRAWDSANVRTSEKNSYCGDTPGCNAYTANGNEVTQDSEMHQYLATVYSNIDSKDLDDEIDDSNVTGNIGLINIKDYIDASTSKDYTKNNWLNINEGFWTITSVKNTNNMVWSIDKSGKIVVMSASDKNGVRPVLNITGTINLLGDGTKDNPYTLNI